MNLPTIESVVKSIDYAILKPELSTDDVFKKLDIAKQYDVFSVCVRPCDVSLASSYLKDTTVKTGTVVGFPHGANTTDIKIAEIRKAFFDGAKEIDMVINISWVKSHRWDDIYDELHLAVTLSKNLGVEVFKIILETAYLTDEETILACETAEKAGVDFVKTSTGFAGEGATIPNVSAMRGAVSDSIQVKASGGITNLDILLEMKELGVTRFGTSAVETIVQELQYRNGDTLDKAETYTEKY